MQSVVYDREEGEIIHSLTTEQIADLIQISPSEVVTEPSKVPDVSPERFDEADEVEIEDLTGEEYPQYTSNTNDDLPTFTEFFQHQSEDVLNRKIEEKTGPSEPSEDDLQQMEKNRKEWIALFKANLGKYKSQTPAPVQYTKFYKTRGRRTSGQILSWGYFADLQCYGVKRERGVEYFKFPHDFKTLPGFELNRLNYLNMLYSSTSGLASYFQDLLRTEYKRKWVNLKPQVPKRIVSKTEIDPISNKPKVVLVYKPPRTMNKIPLRKMIQDFSPKFKWWYYDGRTHEAVIVLCHENNWETIRVFDPMWLTNCSKDDVYTLYKTPIFYDISDMEQALQYRNVIRICFAYDIHSGSNWKEQSQKYASEIKYDLNE